MTRLSQAFGVVGPQQVSMLQVTEEEFAELASGDLKEDTLFKRASRQIKEQQERSTNFDILALVRTRVKMGGHDVPEEVIRRRFARGWKNFENIYKSVVDEWALYDNSGNRPLIIEEGYLWMKRVLNLNQ